MMEEYSFFSKKGQRELSPFFARALYHDFLLGRLDPERRNAIEQFIRSHPDEEQELASVERGLNLCDELSQTKVSQDIIKEICQARPKFQRKLGQAGWYQWPTSIRWFIEAGMVSAVVIFISLLLPWDEIKDSFFKEAGSLLLTQVERAKDVDVVDDKKPEASEHETIEASSKALAVPVGDGTVYRLYLSTKAIDETVEKIKAELKTAEVTKVGDADLGWRRPGGSYFHFTIDQEKRAGLLSAFRSFGALGIRKEAHEQVMPPGIDRIILWVEEVETE